MPDSFDPSGLAGLPAQAAEAASALAALKEPAEKAASAIDDAFSRAGQSLTRSLARAASDGKVTLGELAAAVIAAIDASAGLGHGGLGDALAKVVGTVFSGARADGGPVTAGGAYLVGERGPELFRPASAGAIEPAQPGAITVNLNLSGSTPAALPRSDAQLAQALARAMSLGARRF